MPETPTPLSANALVAYNLARIRKMRGWSQEEAAERLQPYLGSRWSKAVYSAAERSFDGKRVRQFDANDLVAMAAAFEVPILFFFVPPRPEDRNDGHLRSGERDVSWPGLFEVMFGGDMRSAFITRLFELPREERPSADSYLAQLLNNTAMPTSMEDFARQQAAGEAAFADPKYHEGDPS